MFLYVELQNQSQIIFNVSHLFIATNLGTNSLNRADVWLNNTQIINKLDIILRPAPIHFHYSVFCLLIVESRRKDNNATEIVDPIIPQLPNPIAAAARLPKMVHLSRRRRMAAVAAAEKCVARAPLSVATI